ncbi:3'-5' exonuclease [Paracoccus sp. S3-43]|uniref:3'-5' exonuclease n=1 Tax=Paracoccus sp. S3-43 TaxID=3030011 RepID=UPI0023AF224C|nr:3'-5' exonuclease [Paracoccus sp. S3-43]WEF24683.1 3'-5' exonuclease [Paracoccus sp. S3-43]
MIRSLLTKAVAEVEGARFTPQFLLGEWEDVVDAWQIRTWEDYRDVARLGRKTRIGGKQREALWVIFQKVRAGLMDRGTVTWSDVFGRVTEAIAAERQRPYDFAMLDEAQDLSIAEARFLATLAGDKENGLFFAGDIGQRIFQQPFSWKMLGIDVRGRSSTLRINYRTSHQIRAQADRLLPSLVSDVDGNSESRRGTVSIFDGPAPIIQPCCDANDEVAKVAAWLHARLGEGISAEEIAVFVRSNSELGRARRAVKAAGLPHIELGEKAEMTAGSVAVCTMHFAKGLEFRAVAVIACDDDIIPQAERIAAIADEADLEAVYETERHLLYVACTRARDCLLVSGIEPLSEFVADLTS